MNILFLVNTYFPRGVAFSSRAVSFCRMLNHMGHIVHVIAMRSKEVGVESRKVYSFEHCTYECATDTPGNGLESFVGNKAYFRCIKEYIANHKVDAVLTSACPHDFVDLQKICIKTGIPLYLEQCEWYDSSNYQFGRFDPRYLQVMQLIDNKYKKADGIIAISRLLNDHYTKQCASVVRIPAILDVQKAKWRFKVSGLETRYQVVYTGSCGVSKEYLKPMIEALALKSELRERFAFHVYGPSEENVLMNIGRNRDILDQAGQSVVLHGHVPQEEIQQILSDADFQIFIRPVRRSSNAGFPTKLGESMCVGTPVITNNTGDIGLYLQDGVNGYMLKDTTIDAVVDVLHRILETSEEQQSNMRKAARQTAEQSFDYRAYSHVLDQLIKQRKDDL